eukprot:scaffold23234_cov67-Cyclotella_meneghiniana.AAC.5
MNRHNADNHYDGKEEIYEHFTIRHHSSVDKALGFAAFATQDIPKHTLILAEEPLLSGIQVKNALKLYEDNESTNQDDDIKYLTNECELDDTQIHRIWRMHDQYIHTYDTPEKRLWGIIYSNAFYSTDKQFEPGLYPTAARINHSCSPNVGYEFNGWSIRMYTTRFVSSGEELCDCYSDVVYYQTQQVRKVFFEVKFGFNCQCLLCKVDKDSDALMIARVVESNRRRKRLKELAIILSDRLHADFLYSPSFADEVARIVRSYNGSCDDVDETSDEDVEGDRDMYTADDCQRYNTQKGKLQTQTRNSRFKPKDMDLDMMLEYIELLENEGMDHDIAAAYELCYDVAIFLGDRECIRQYKLGQRCLDVLKVSKGERHRITKKYRARMQKDDL